MALAADALAVVLASAELAVVAVAGEVIALAEIAGDDLKWLQSCYRARILMQPYYTDMAFYY